jgi:hypothetical protein
MKNYLTNFDEKPFFEKNNKKKKFKECAIHNGSYDFNSMAIVRKRSGSIKGIKYDDLIDISYSYNAPFFNYMINLDCPSFYNRINPMWTIPLSLIETEHILKRFFKFIVMLDEEGYFCYVNDIAPEYKDDHGINYLKNPYELTKVKIETIISYFDSKIPIDEKLSFYCPDKANLKHSFMNINDAFKDNDSLDYFAEKLLIRYCTNDSEYLKYVGFNLVSNQFKKEGNHAKEISIVINRMRNCFDEHYRGRTSP